MTEEAKSEIVWAVRGIPDYVRRAVVARAKAEGRTVGAWVTDALRRALADDAVDKQLSDLRRRIEMLERESAPRRGDSAAD